MKLQLVRHAALLLDYAGMKILVDPMLRGCDFLEQRNGVKRRRARDVIFQ
jgi:L-ascorbate metabolism protein UlaG (beta-lactamase superfamily)